MFQLSPQEQHYLLHLSRQTIEQYLTTRTKPNPTSEFPELLEKRGAFVTLHQRGRLRGCIGFVLPLYPLCQTVVDCSVSAATEDPRFAPVQLEDISSLDIEISVLSPLEIVNGAGTIEVGTHGLVVSQHGRRGLLLPQVAVQYNWDREQFLCETCRKAGLAADAWLKGAQIESFTAFVFGELNRGEAGKVN